MTSAPIVLLRTQSDARLIALARDGHERAFEAIVERYRRQLMRTCRRVLPEARAEDALQQALLAAWTAVRRGDDVRELRPWLHRIAHRTALNQLRMSGYDFDELHDALRVAGGPEEEFERRAVMRQTLAGLAELPQRQREALLAIAVEGRSQDEVAHDLGLTSGAVRQLVHRARSSLRAAATAVTPLPLVTWAAAATTRAEPLTARIAELTASGGAAAALAKAGTVVVLAGGAAAGPAVVERAATHRHADHAQSEANAATHAAERLPAAAPHPAATTTAAPRRVSVAPPRRSAPAPAKPRPVAYRPSPAAQQQPAVRGDRDDGSGDDDRPQVEATPTPEPDHSEIESASTSSGDSGSGSSTLSDQRDGSGSRSGETDSSGPGGGLEEPSGEPSGGTSSGSSGSDSPDGGS